MRHADAASKAGYRHARLEELVLEELRALLRDEAGDPALEAVSILALTLSVDYRHARVSFALSPSAEKRAAARALDRATPFLRARLAESIEMKRVPELRFVFDDALAVDPEPERPPSRRP